MRRKYFWMIAGAPVFQLVCVQPFTSQWKTIKQKCLLQKVTDVEFLFFIHLHLHVATLWLRARSVSITELCLNSRQTHTLCQLTPRGYLTMTFCQSLSLIRFCNRWTHPEATHGSYCSKRSEHLAVYDTHFSAFVKARGRNAAADFQATWM